MSASDRIKKIIDYNRISVRKFAETIGVPQTTLNNVIKRGSDPGIILIEKILVKYDSINPNWLVFGKGEMLVSSEPKQHTDATVELELEIEKLKSELDLKDKFIQSLEGRIKDKEETILAQKEIISAKEEIIHSKEETIESLTKQLESTKKGQTFATQRT